MVMFLLAPLCPPAHSANDPVPLYRLCCPKSSSAIAMRARRSPKPMAADRSALAGLAQRDRTIHAYTKEYLYIGARGSNGLRHSAATACRASGRKQGAGNFRLL